jgi:RNA polymerase sigma factor (TIGR02999 family)
MSDVTRILSAIEQGEPHAAEQLLPLVYDELRRLAARKLARDSPGQTLEATALVHEAYLRLVGSDRDQSWENRGHFVAAAAEAMRRILIDRARDRERLKRGGGAVRAGITAGLPPAIDQATATTVGAAGLGSRLGSETCGGLSVGRNPARPEARDSGRQRHGSRSSI